MRLHQMVVRVGVGMAIATSSVSVSAAPYEFIAVYQGPDKLLEVPIDPGTMIPSRGGGATLLRVVARFSQEGLGGTSTAMFKKFSIGVRTTNGKHNAKGVLVEKIGAKTDLVLFDWSEIKLTERETFFALDVHGKFADDYLCSEERAFRAAQKPVALKPQGTQPKLTPAQEKKEAEEKKRFLAVSYEVGGGKRKDLFLRDPANPIRGVPLLDEQTGTEILYSFCDPNGVNWAQAKSFPNVGFGQTVEKTEDLEKLHRRRLSELLIGNGTLKRFATGTQPLIYGLDDKNDTVDKTGHEHKSEIYISSDFRFSVLITDKLYTLTEESRDRVHDGLTTLFDQDSRVALEVGRTPGHVCPQVASPSFAYRIQKTADSPTVDVKAVEAKATPVDVKTDFREPCVFTLNMNLKDYLDKTVSLTVVYKLHVIAGASRAVVEVPLFTTSFRVAHIGVIASLPVASEIYAVATSKSSDDINATSSIPLSYGVRYRGDGDRHNLAVTFPLRVGFNTRSAPDLAKTVSVFGHISFLFPVDDPATPTLSFGFGVSVLQALHISWAFDLDGSRYLLAGVSVTDIAKALKPNGK